MKISQMLNKLWDVHKFLGEIWKMNKNGITWKLEKGEKSFLHMTHCIYLRHISKTLHEDITSGYQNMGCARMKTTQNNKISIKQENAIPLK